ncbi:hypothetical protein BGZ73_008108 [Actinomortierella ambigua]|nr:hypothetical protein BGZ73_008108 [Actinomortierella ambigua]
MTPHANPRPVDMADILLQIASHLSPADYKVCAVVCKAWHQNFQPLVWRSLNALNFILLNRCRSLKSITVSTEGLTHWKKLDKLIRLNPGVSNVLQDKTTALDVNYSSLSLRIKRSEKQDTDTQDLDAHALSPRKFAVRDIEEDIAIDRLSAILEQAGHEEYDSGYDYGYYWEEELYGLRSIHTLRLTSGRIDDSPLVALVAALAKNSLQEATISAEDGDIFRTLIQKQHESLVRLFGFIHGWPRHDIVASILDKCSNLQLLDLDLDDSLDIRAVLNGPWACKDIEEMVLPLDIDPDCNDPELRRIAWREKLEIHPYRDEHEQAELVFVYLLAKLKSLRRVDFGDLRLNNHCVMQGFWPGACILNTIPTEYREVDY